VCVILASKAIAIIVAVAVVGKVVKVDKVDYRSKKR
jgi:hypothetical protein